MNSLPPRTLAVINVHIDLKSIHEGYIYDVKPSQAYINELPNTVQIPTMYEVEKACSTEVPCVVINLSTKNTHSNR